MNGRMEEIGAFHRANIIGAAERLLESGERATVDDVAREARYSKSTVYRYFESKEEIEAHIALRAMRALRALLGGAMEKGTFRAKYDAACAALTDFYGERPLYFESALKNISVEFEGRPEVFREIYEEGEEINRVMTEAFEEAVKNGESDVSDLPTAVMTLWSALTGVIRLGFVKEPYIGMIAGGREKFLRGAFDLLYRTVAKERA